MLVLTVMLLDRTISVATGTGQPCRLLSRGDGANGRAGR